MLTVNQIKDVLVLLLKSLVLVIKGMVIGLSMLIPGVSGGTMAVIMGIFDPLINAIGSFYKHFKQSLMVVIPIGVGAGVGILAFSTPIVYMLENLYAPTLFLFMGAVLGGIPSIFKETGIQKGNFKISQPVLFFVGVAVVVAIALLPKDMLSLNTNNAVASFLVLMAAGVISSVSLVLPGISGSYMLLLLGLYESVMRAVKALDISLLLPLGFGIVAGILFITKLLQFLLKKHRRGTFTVILGFIVASVFELFPGVPQGAFEWVLSVVFFVVGLGVILFVSRFEKSETPKVD